MDSHFAYLPVCYNRMGLLQSDGCKPDLSGHEDDVYLAWDRLAQGSGIRCRYYDCMALCASEFHMLLPVAISCQIGKDPDCSNDALCTLAGPVWHLRDVYNQLNI